MTVEAGRRSVAVADRRIDLGTASIEPAAPVVAGDFITWTIVYTVGQHGVDDGGSLLFAVRQMCDWGEPQVAEPGQANYITASTTADARLLITWNRRCHLRPWRHGVLVTVVDGHLAPGDQVIVVLGDRSSGGPGLRAQTFVEECFAIRVLVDPSGSHQFNHVNDLDVPILAGPAVGLALVGPSAVSAGTATWLHIRAHDRWGNLADSYRGTVAFASDGAVLPDSYQLTGADGGFHRFGGVVFRQAGVHRVTARDAEHGFTAIANPCRVAAEGDTPSSLFWGDLHGQSGETVGSGDAAAYWDFLHNASGAEYGALCGNDFQITPEFYRRLRELVRQHHEPGRFVSFLSYEWSANYPAGGDHNVYFLHDDPERSQIHRSGQWLLETPADDGDDRHPLPELRDTFRDREDVLIVPHIGGRRANLDMLDDVRQSPVIEISSIHGRFFWFARDALERGLKVGFIAGSDDHCGRPGVAPPSTHDLVVPGGLSAIYAPELTRASLWEGLTARRCYGSSGARIIVDVDGDGHPMGSEYQTTTPHFRGVIHGTAPVSTVELRRGLDVVWTLDHLTAPPPDWTKPSARARLRVVWSGAKSKNRPKVAHWTGGLTLENGHILAAAPYNLRHPEEGLLHVDQHHLSWTSHTSGEADGVWLDLEVGPGTLLRFETEVLACDIALADIGDQPLIVPAGGVDLQLELRWTREEQGPLDVAWEWTDEDVPAGEHAYWLWVTQGDGECAWSSPIWVTVDERRAT